VTTSGLPAFGGLLGGMAGLEEPERLELALLCILSATQNIYIALSPTLSVSKPTYPPKE
jgi:hypothetical protein